jgi:hypothetical protein
MTGNQATTGLAQDLYGFKENITEPIRFSSSTTAFYMDEADSYLCSTDD